MEPAFTAEHAGWAEKGPPTAIEDMASYDYLNNRCYVLNAGTYEIKLMGNSHDLIDSREYQVDSAEIYGEGNPRSGDLTAAVEIAATSSTPP